MIGLFADDEMKEQKEIEIRLNKNRDGPSTRFRAIWNHEENDLSRTDARRSLQSKRSGTAKRTKRSGAAKETLSAWWSSSEDNYCS